MPKVKTRVAIAYALPLVPIALLTVPTAIVQGIYAKYFGLALTSIAGVILFVRMFDAVTDPLIGYLSDRYQRSGGTRKPFIIIGALLTAFSGYFLYAPPNQVGVWYFTTWYMMLYLGYTLFEIPHLTSGGELATSSVEKARTYSFRTAAGYIGMTLFYCIPLLPLFNSSEITPESLRWVALSAGLLIVPVLFIYTRYVPSYPATGLTTTKSSSTKGEKFRVILNILTQNKPFQWFLAAYFFTGLGLGMWYGIIFIYVDAYLGQGAVFAKVFVLAFLVGLLTTPIWYKVAQIFGKKISWGLVMALLSISYFYTGLLTVDNANFKLLLMLKIINTVAYVGMGILGPAVLAEIVDYSTLKFGENFGATHFAIYQFTMKAVGAFGAAIALGIAGWFGFDAAASMHSEESIVGLIVVTSWLPALSCVFAAVFLFKIPMNEQKHTEIRRQLELRSTLTE